VKYVLKQFISGFTSFVLFKLHYNKVAEMKIFIVITCLIFIACTPALRVQTTTAKNTDFNILLEQYHDETLKFNPFNATSIGDTRYNHVLPIEFTDSYRAQLANFYRTYQSRLGAFKRENLNDNDKLSYDILHWRLGVSLQGLQHKDNRFPFSQFTGTPLQLAQYGSGTVVQPFKTSQDYENWIQRAGAFPIWVDSAITYFRKGIAERWVLPRAVVEKMIPQMERFITNDPTQSVFYGPVNLFPATFTTDEKKRYTNSFVHLINNAIVPSYRRLADFLRNEYLPASRSSSGIGALPGGSEWYLYLTKLHTTTDQTPDQIYNTGLSEVKRIQAEMEIVKNSVGFTGTLPDFFTYMRTDPQFFPYKTAEEVLDAYRAIEQRIEPHLQKMFLQTPKTSFEVRQTEEFRAASAAAQYNAGLADGSRPGIFYLPILDPTKMKVRESLFIHEAIPGHHYQVMLQRENEALPSFRRYSGFTAYSEGWGLYSESLGKELGLYTDPYQYMNALGDEIHRAIRLVVDPGLHSKGWTREQAIKYMMDNSAIAETTAVPEIERYMVIPGQALSYKTGSMHIQMLRDKYTKQLGVNFDLAAFHHEILKDGPMPLELLERKMDAWAETQK
jgi:uncharacterized protein (DUF885 family)